MSFLVSLNIHMNAFTVVITAIIITGRQRHRVALPRPPAAVNIEGPSEGTPAVWASRAITFLLLWWVEANTKTST